MHLYSVPDAIFANVITPHLNTTLEQNVISIMEASKRPRHEEHFITLTYSKEQFSSLDLKTIVLIRTQLNLKGIKIPFTPFFEFEKVIDYSKTFQGWTDENFNDFDFLENKPFSDWLHSIRSDATNWNWLCRHADREYAASWHPLDLLIDTSFPFCPMDIQIPYKSIGNFKMMIELNEHALAKDALTRIPPPPPPGP
jgi:hypothetical protein